MSTPTPEQLEELVLAAGELNDKLAALSALQKEIESHRKLIKESQAHLDVTRPLRNQAVEDVRSASVRFRLALEATDPT